MRVDWAVIPVAGRGARMQPLSRAVPKELLPLGRKPVVQHVVEELVAAGVHNLVFVTSPDKPAIRDFLDDADFWRGQLSQLTTEEIRFHFVDQRRQIGLGDAVLQARSLVAPLAFVVALGDSVIRGQGTVSLLQRMLDQANHTNFGAVIAFEQVPASEVPKYGIAKVASEGSSFTVLDLVEKPSTETAPSRWAIAGRYVLSPDVFQFLEKAELGKGGEVQLTDAIRGMLRGGRSIIGVPLQLGEKRFDVGEFVPYFHAFEEYAAAEQESSATSDVKRSSASGGRTRGDDVVIGTAFARAGLLGNPSDGYWGKTISCILGNWSAEVRLVPSENLCFQTGPGELRVFDSVDEFIGTIKKHGYYGGLRLIQAATKRFFDFCGDEVQEPRRNFLAEYSCNIPRQLGLGGSSAIVIATLRALAEFYDVQLPREWTPSLALSAETVELGIPAGLQDRVIQTYEGLVYMDFAKERATTQGDLSRGVYEELDFRRLPGLYVAISESAAEPTEVIHSDLRKRFDRGDHTVIDAIRKFADIAEAGRSAILNGDCERLAELMNANFDLRRSICKILPEHVQMVDVARSAGASAKFCGSGGAIVGICSEGRPFERLTQAMASLGAKVVRPRIGIWHGGKRTAGKM